MYTMEGIDYAREGLVLLEEMAQGGLDAWCENVRKYRERYDLSAVALDELMTAIRRVGKSVAVPQEVLARDFTALEDDEQLSLALTGLHLRDCQQGAQNGDERAQRVRDMLCELLDMSDVSPKNPSEMVAMLMQSQASDKLKWFCVEALHDLPGRMQPVWSAIRQAEEALMGEAAILEPMAEQCVGRLLQAWTRDGYERHLERLGIHLDEQPVVVHPSPVACFQLQITERVPLRSEGMVEYIGLCVDLVSGQNDRREWTDEELYRLIHAMDDKNRMLILTLLRQSPRIGRELSQATGLTPATVSHHMNELFHGGLVTLEKLGNTIEYRLCSAKIAQGLHQLLARWCEHDDE